MSARRQRVLLADDHGLIAAGIRELLEARYEVIGIVDNGRALVETAQAERPDVIVADLSMPEMDGLEATRKLRQILPRTPVIILTMHDDTSHVKAAFAAGASGYLVKSSAPRELFEAMRQVLAGGRYLTSVIAGQVMGALTAPQPAAPKSLLTPREIEISTLVGEGLENAEIADRLCIAEVTVRTHFHRILRKLEVRNRVELARHALAEGWAS
jgi:DNA-binding NarL/FixJ family response regulator